MLDRVVDALQLTSAMTWEILWALILGFALSALVQAVVSKGEMSRVLPDDSPRSITIACGLGAASSSCSYAAVALARSLFQKGANFTAAMAFEFASTNLVIELGIIMAILLGWEFTLAEFAGGPIMVAIMVVLFRLFLSNRLLETARAQAARGLRGSMEGHAAMDMSVREGPLLKRVFSARGFTATSHYFLMDWAAVYRDIVGGLVIAGVLGAFVPKEFWTGFFLTGHPVVAAVWGPLVGPLVSVVSFVCSIGNVPLAAVLWNGGISFGGVISFIFADLIVLPILNIYRKYYGAKMMAFLFVTSYTAMVAAGLLVEAVFQLLDLVPENRVAIVAEPHITLNYTTYLNVAFMVLAVALLWRAARTGGFQMLAAMNEPPPAETRSAISSDGEGAAAWTCPMHPDVRSNEPGRCPRCGMALVRAAEPDAARGAAREHSHRGGH